MEEWKVSKFVAQLKDEDENYKDDRFSYLLFLGAGCSVSSGIKAAGPLVKEDWLPRLHKRDYSEISYDDWLSDNYDDEDGYGQYYSDVVKELFPHPPNRQKEIEKLCKGKLPGFAYATLAQLISDQDRNFEMVLTTNFDDLLADALFLFTGNKPMVIQHDSLIGYLSTVRTSPTIVKLHGDIYFEQKNTEEEIGELGEEVQIKVKGQIPNRTLIFIGYGGHDKGVNEMLKEIRREDGKVSIYWVSSREPKNDLNKWLEEHGAIWVKSDPHDGFDKLALLLKQEFNLKRPDEKRIKDIFDRYDKTYEELRKDVKEMKPDEPDVTPLKEAIKAEDKTYPEWRQLVWQANAIDKENPDKAEELFKKALEIEENAITLGDYARLLHYFWGNYDKAEELYKRALEIDPNDAFNLGNYANFLKDISKDHDKAEELYKRALEIDPNNVPALGNYAEFLIQLNRVEEAKGLADRTVTVSLEQGTRGFLLMAYFFRLILVTTTEHKRDAFAMAKKLLHARVRFPSWRFIELFDALAERGHPDIDWLRKLADVINDKADISTLDGWVL